MAKWQKVSKIAPSNKNLQSSGVWLQSHLNSGFVGSGLMWSDHAKSKIFCCKYLRAKVENPVEKRLVLRRWGSGRDTGILNSMTSLNNQLTNSYQFYHPSPDLLTSFTSLNPGFHPSQGQRAWAQRLPSCEPRGRGCAGCGGGGA